MSIRIMSDVWDSADKLKDSPLLVMLAMADYCNEDRECWPSIKSLAEKARISQRQTQRIIRALQAHGYLSVSNRGGKHLCNVYTLAPAAVLSTLSAPKLDSNWKNDTSDGVTLGVESGDTDGCEVVPRVSPHPSEIRQDPSLKSAHLAAIRAVMDYFTQITGLKPIGSETQVRWRAPAQEILEMVEWDIGAANRLVLSAYQKMRGDHLTYNSIQSIVRTAAFIHAQETAPVRSGMKAW